MKRGENVSYGTKNHIWSYIKTTVVHKKVLQYDVPFLLPKIDRFLLSFIK